MTSFWLRRKTAPVRHVARRERARCALRSLGIEALESRRVLAPVINELHFNPLFGSSNEDQYVEIRGEAGQTLADGTYLVVVEGDAFSNAPGAIHTVFDLSGLQLGSNGFLVLTQQNSSYAIHPHATALQGTSGGFGGLRAGQDMPDVDRFRDASSLSNNIDFIFGSNTFFLIESATPPAPGGDLDSDNDGVADGAFGDWTVLDGVSVLDGGANDIAYANLVFAVNGAGITPSGAQTVSVPAVSWLGRNDDTTGATPADWIAGQTVERENDTFLFRLLANTAAPPAFSGRNLDHVGAPNFFASVSGVVFHDRSGDGVQQGDEPGLAEVTVHLDHNHNGLVDRFTTTAEPDVFDPGTPVRNAFSGVTLTTTTSDNRQLDLFEVDVVADDRASTGDNVFAYVGTTFWWPERRLRMDFYEPVDSVSLDFIGFQALQDEFGRLRVYDAQGNELESVLTPAVREGQVQTMTISRPQADIAYAVAYADDQGFPRGLLDNLRFTQPERRAATAADGSYAIERVVSQMAGFPGEYHVRQVPPSGFIQTFPTGNGAHLLTAADTANLQPINFGARANQTPIVVAQTFNVDENSPAGAAVGNVAALDPDSGQSLTFQIVGGTGQGKFNLHATTGLLTVAPAANLDFETTESYTLEVRVTDNSPIAASATATITIDVNDVNEPPTQILLPVIEIPENTNTSSGAVLLGNLSANDPDADAFFSFQLVGEPGGDASDNHLFQIVGGQLWLRQGVVLDHESRPTLTLRIEASDGEYALETTFTLVVTDMNEPPHVADQTFGVQENTPLGAPIGEVAASDPDQNEPLTFAVVGGSGAAFFAVDPETGEITVTGNLDYESNPSYSLMLQVSDGVSPSQTAAITINVIDVEDGPVDVTLEAIPINENANTAAGPLVVGQLVVVAPGGGENSPHTFTVVGGEHAEWFAIDGDTLLLVQGAELDHETDAELSVVIQASNGADSVEATITVTIGDVNEAPTEIRLSNNSVSDAADYHGFAVYVGDLSVVDPDSPGAFAPFAFELESDLGGDDNGSFQIVGNRLQFRAGESLDHHVKESYSVRIKAHDGDHTLSQAFVVHVTDGNKAPVALNDGAMAGPQRSVQIDVLANDSDADGVLDPASLDITADPQHGSITVGPGGVITYTPAERYTGQDFFRYTIADNDGAVSNEAVVTITVEQGPPWQNSAMPEDTNVDGVANLFDLIMLVEFLRENGSNHALTGLTPDGRLVDVNGDSWANIQDVLLLVTYLRSSQMNAEPEGGEPEGGEPDDVAKEESLAPDSRASRSPATPSSAAGSFVFLADDEDDRWETMLNEVACDVAKAHHAA